MNRLVKEYYDNKLSVLFITDPVAFQGWSGMRNGRTDQDRFSKRNWDTCIAVALRTGALRDILVTQWFPIHYNTKL